MRDPIRVLTLADDRYAMPLAVMGRSLLEHHSSDRLLHLRIIDGGVTAENRKRIEHSWSSAARGPALWDWVAPRFGSAKDLPSWGRVPSLTYARLLVGQYFELEAGRVVIADSDLLVLRDIAELHDCELGTAALGACVDPFIPTVSARDGLPNPKQWELAADAPYFNAGLMVVDVKRYREQQVSERALGYLDQNFRQLRHYDQDALNACIGGKWTKLDDRWNTHPRTRYALGKTPVADPWIVHFSGRLKPWLYRGGTPLDSLYMQYLSRTDWAGYQLPNNWKARIYELYDSPLRRPLHNLEEWLLAAQRALRLRLLSKRAGG
jgi:lipopolysaccharide biosynthesis glycosyltransferase